MPARSFRFGSTLAGVALLLAAAGCSTGGTATAVPGVSISSTSSTESSSTEPSSTESSSTQDSTSSGTSTPDSITTPPSGDTSSATADSSSPSTAASSPATDASSPEPSSSAAPTSTGPKPSGSAAPGGKLDPATVAWFNNSCAIQKQLQSLASPKTSGSLSTIKGQVSAAYSRLSTTGKVGKLRLTSTPPPTFAGGAAFKAAQVDRMQAIADEYGRGSKSIAAATFKTPAELKAAIEKIEAGVSSAVDQALAKAPPLPAGIKPAVEALPACAGLT